MSSTTWILPASIPASTPSLVTLGDGRIDHVAKALSRLPEQLKNSAVIIALLKALLAPAQEIEDMFYALLALKSIDDATGAQLDLIGKLVGQPRGGNLDPDYRKFIRVRLSVNKSRGLRSDYIKIISLLYPTAKIEVRARANATAEVTIHNVIISDADAAIIMSFLQLAHGAGVRVVLGTFPGPEDTAFTYRWAAVLAANTIIGATTFTFPTTLDVQAFGASGFVKFMTTGEVVAYTPNATYTALTVKAPGLTQAHTAGEIVERCTSGGLIFYPELTARGYDIGVYANGIQSIDP
jgi:hypothetical protein